MIENPKLSLLKKDVNLQIKIAIFLNSINDSDEMWEKIGRNYCKQVCFRNYILDEVTEDKNKAKLWFKEQKKWYWSDKKLRIIIKLYENNEVSK